MGYVVSMHTFNELQSCLLIVSTYIYQYDVLAMKWFWKVLLIYCVHSWRLDGQTDGHRHTILWAVNVYIYLTKVILSTYSRID